MGRACRSSSRRTSRRPRSTGFPLILIVLLAVFGSVLAALLPVGLGVAAVIITGAAVYFLSLAITMSVFVTNVASMLGIGVAVDYSLFVLSRYREELHAGKIREPRRSMSPCGPPARPSSSPASP